MLVFPDKNTLNTLTSRKSAVKKKLKALIWSAIIVLVCSIPHVVYGMESCDDKRPHEHFCPITLEVMRDPVVANDGHSVNQH